MRSVYLAFGMVGSSSSLDVFGRSSRSLRGPRGFTGAVGPVGAAGADGVKFFCKWFPNTAIQEICAQEVSCLSIEDVDEDLVIDKSTGMILKWNSLQTRENNALKPVKVSSASKKISKIREGVFGLNFNGETLYRMSTVVLSPYGTGHWLWVCITFKLTNSTDGGDDVVNDEQYIISNKPTLDQSSAYRGVSVRNHNILRIWGGQRRLHSSSMMETNQQQFIEIESSETLIDQWITVYVMWSGLGKRLGNYVVYISGKKYEGIFTTQETSMFLQSTIEFGGVVSNDRTTVKNTFVGVISRIDFYSHETITSEDDPKEEFPNILRDLVIRNHIQYYRI